MGGVVGVGVGVDEAGIGHEGHGGHDAASKVLEEAEGGQLQIVVVGQETDMGRGGWHERDGEDEEGSAWAGHM